MQKQYSHSRTSACLGPIAFSFKSRIARAVPFGGADRLIYLLCSQQPVQLTWTILMRSMLLTSISNLYLYPHSVSGFGNSSPIISISRTRCAGTVHCNRSPGQLVTIGDQGRKIPRTFPGDRGDPISQSAGPDGIPCSQVIQLIQYPINGQLMGIDLKARRVFLVLSVQREGRD